MLIATANLTASPGATTAAVALSAHWPDADQRPMVVECDPHGGDLILRHRLGLHPGLSDAAAALTSGSISADQVLAEVVQTVEAYGASVPVVVTGPGGDETRSALPLLSASGAKALNPPEAVVIADLGRLDPASVSWPVAASADLLVCVMWGTLAGVGHVRWSLDKMRLLETLGVGVALVVREVDYTRAEVADAFRAQGLELHVLGPLGPAAAGATRRWPRRPRRTSNRWTALAVAVREAAAGGPLALPAGASTDAEEERQ